MQTRKKRCQETKCVKYGENAAIMSEKFHIDIKAIMPATLKKLEKSLSDPALTDKLTPDEKKRAKRNYKTMKKLYNVSIKYMKNKTKNRKKIAKSTLKLCANLYCNSGCKGTEFESGIGLPKSILNKWTKKPKWLEYLKKERVERFGNKTNVLVDDFYEGIDPKMMAKAKKDGAISGCVDSI